MPGGPNKLSQFWQELKRRKVVRVITVYAAAAFVILELVSIIVEPLKLPEWFLPMVIVLLCIGFIIAIILSWIYDIKPEGGIVKTEPAYEAKKVDIPPSSNSWKIASYISFVVIVGLIILNILPQTNRSSQTEILDKSIAVLPFESLSDDPELQYQADGIMDAILLHLSKIEELRVMSRTSVEQYRDTRKTIPEISAEMGVSYVLEGSFQKSGDHIRLIVQLIQSGKEGHVWANNYDREWKDIFTVQSEVAQSVAGELKAVITPQEKELLTKIPTTSLTAYDYYLKAREESWKIRTDFYSSVDRITIEKAKKFYSNALKYDSTFAQAYAGLSEVYFKLFTLSGYLSLEDIDSTLLYLNKAIDYDNQLALAHSLKGSYFYAKGDFERASEELDIAVGLNPNDYNIYLNQANLFTLNGFAKTIEYLYKATSFLSGSELIFVMEQISLEYVIAGFFDLGRQCAEDILKLKGDSLNYYLVMASIEAHLMRFDRAIEWYDKYLSFNPQDMLALNMKALLLGFVGKYEESLRLYSDNYENVVVLSQMDEVSLHRLGYAYWQTGNREMAEYYFDKQIEYCNRIIELEMMYERQGYSYYDLAAIYAFRGEKEKAFENLRLYNQRVQAPWLAFVNFLKKVDPLLESIRFEPEFQQIFREVEAKYQAEHERVRQWLEENDML